MADTCNLALYEDKEFALPDNFFDDYNGREAAAAQEMSIVKDMDMIYDNRAHALHYHPRIFYAGTVSGCVDRCNL